ncbi:I78 family peptidase inhibitor [Paracoccus lutimaris]|uniref:Peptidase inhibitor I78 family protein n=1 Tax=Paracoccus lutimaris TaxID=1490030 RepID=A0A368YRM3_9RHOB|nr:I78 family peptidase inhibitor [Paracoccus lutimaris]RCW82875.1 peptidase inhibitor I78 family protein [Paracoccus lutimaris]
MKKLLIVCALGGLGACSWSQPDVPATPPATDACGAARLQGLIGQSDALLRDMKLPEGTRVIGPRDAVTADYRETRMNFEIGADGRIAKVACY